MQLVLFAGISYICTLLIVPLIQSMIIDAGFVKPNYRNEHIPLGVGLVFFISIVLTSLVILALFKEHTKDLLIMLFTISGMTILGLIDDLLGSGDTRGLKGHFRKLFKEKQLTTGGLKAIMGGLIALTASVLILPIKLDAKVLGLIILYTLLIALSTNFMNLLDLRPGRASKVFLLVAGLLILVGFSVPESALLGPLFGSLLAYLPKDLAAKAMMGDTGSNVLGVTLGLFSVWLLPLGGQVVALALLILLHIITEKYSLTKIIEKNRVLRYLDMLGRE